MPDHSHPVVIVGAGLAGLCCARHLQSNGVATQLLEANPDRVGGRVATDVVDGYRLDVGFQVLLGAYPEAREMLDLAALDARSFRPGSLIQHGGGKTSYVADPGREPLRAAKSLFSPAVSVSSAFSAMRLRSTLLDTDRTHQGTAAELLTKRKFPEPLLSKFLQPFFAGVTLDPKLEIPADYFAFLFRMFASGDTLLPANGMGAIPTQLAAGLQQGTVRLGARVTSVQAHRVELEDGTAIPSAHVVVATEGHIASQLTDSPAPESYHGTTTLYFGTERAPFDEPALMLNGSGTGQTLHLSVPSNVQPTYAPPGRALVSVSQLGATDSEDTALFEQTRSELRDWFGNAVDGWTPLRTYRIPFAQPKLPAGAAMNRSGVIESHGVTVCGDHLATPSIQGAMLAGRNAAKAALRGRPA